MAPVAEVNVTEKTIKNGEFTIIVTIDDFYAHATVLNKDNFEVALLHTDLRPNNFWNDFLHLLTCAITDTM